jgi:hypothetical protein
MAQRELLWRLSRGPMCARTIDSDDLRARLTGRGNDRTAGVPG